MAPVGRRQLTLLAVFLAAALAPASCVGARSTRPRARSRRRSRVPHVAKAATGALAVDLDTGETVFSLHPGLSLRPASNEKLAVTYAALVKLGAGFQLETDVIGQRRPRGRHMDGRPRPPGPRRPDAHLGRPRADGAAGARPGDPARQRPHRRRRELLRRAPHGPGLEAVVLHPGVAAAVGARRRPGARLALHGRRPGDRRGDGVPRRCSARPASPCPARSYAAAAPTTT